MKAIGFCIMFLLISSSITKKVPDDILVTQNIPYYIDIEKALKEPKVLDVSTFGNNLKYILLETTPDCIIKEIDQVEVSNPYIFVSDQVRFFQFDSKGKFVRQIGSVGRGPEEYLVISDFCIDIKEQDIYILSPGKVLVFDFNGCFKRSFKLSYALSEFIFIDQNNLMYHLFNLPGQSGSTSTSWIITDKHGVVSTRIKNHLRRINRPGLIIGDTPLYKYNNTVHFLEFGIDTLYYFHNGQKENYAIFKLGNYKMDADSPINSSTAKRLSDKIWINSINENDDYLFITLFCGLSDSSIYALYDKKTSKTYIVKENGFRNDLDRGLAFWPKHILANNIFLDYVNGIDLLKSIRSLQINGSKEHFGGKSTQLMNLGKQLTETSNPVLVLLQ